MELDRRAAEFASFDEDSDVDGAATDEMEPSDTDTDEMEQLEF